MTSSYHLEKPSNLQVIAILTLANGILNILFGLGWSIAALFTLVGIICIPLTLLPVVLGVFEIIYASKLLADPVTVDQPSQVIAILEIVGVVTGNVVSLIVGILALVFYSDTQIKAYFAALQSRPTPASKPTVAPPPSPAPAVAPAAAETLVTQPVVEEAAPEPTAQAPDSDVLVVSLPLNSRLLKALDTAGILSANELLALLAEGDQAVLAIEGIGPKGLEEIKHALAEAGYDLPE